METIGIKDPSLEINFRQILLYFDKVYITSTDDYVLKFKYDCFPELRTQIEQYQKDIDFW
jgi:hypothetical protein